MSRSRRSAQIDGMRRPRQPHQPQRPLTALRRWPRSGIAALTGRSARPPSLTGRSARPPSLTGRSARPPTPHQPQRPLTALREDIRQELLAL